MRRVLISTVAFLLVVEAATGVLLMTVYSPSVQTAWGSVWYAQTQLTFGWLIRGVHRFASDGLIVALGLYLVQLVVSGALLGPCRRVWWAGLALMFLAMGLALSGYTLVWDQHGYWGTTVRTNILALTPYVGDTLRELLIGGTQLGQLTLTRFYALHVIVLPVCSALLAWVSLRRVAAGSRAGHGARDETVAAGGDDAGAWRGPVHALVWAVALAAVVGAAIYAHAVLGTELLTAPADPSSSDYPARPEWFNLFLFQWLKSFQGPVLEVIGAIVVPGVVVAFFVLLPFGESVAGRRSVGAAGVGASAVLLAGTGWLTYAAVKADENPPDGRVEQIRAQQRSDEPLSEAERAVLRASEYNRQVERARQVARRAFELAADKGIPPEGPLPLLANDPLTRGPELFASHCASCHRYDGHDGWAQLPVEPATSSDLAGFASRAWVRGLLANPMSDDYFGRMKKADGSPAHTKMAEWVAKQKTRAKSQADRRLLLERFDAVAAYLEYESLHAGRLEQVSAYEIDESMPEVSELEETEDGRRILDGRQYFVTVCNECHRYGGVSAGFVDAPEMRGYGSVEWTALMIARPDHELRYGDKARMPRFEERLSGKDRRLLAEWLHRPRQTGPGTAGATATGPTAGRGGGE